MRLDKFLKVSRIIKRRTVSKEAILKGFVKVNHKDAKPSTNVEIGDIILLDTERGKTEYEVISLEKNESGYVRLKG
ncbi:MAG: S4 domain-containing protein [Tissierellia bacterium]|nr:S4 domain-containing protein [Tissierellia bacterium]